MEYYALITLDLKNLKSNDARRKVFDDYLESCKWMKVEDISTTWIAYFKQGDRREVFDSLQEDLIESKVKAQIPHITYAIHIGQKSPEVGFI